MKVFKLEKHNEYYTGNDIFNIKIEEKQKFNCIVINNPENSNYLCVINNLVCKTIGKENIVHLMTAGVNKELKESKNFGTLNIGYEYEKEEQHENLELEMVNVGKNQDIDILEEHFLIILPGGNVSIKLEEPEENMNLGISLGQQII